MILSCMCCPCLLTNNHRLMSFVFRSLSVWCLWPSDEIMEELWWLDYQKRKGFHGLVSFDYYYTRTANADGGAWGSSEKKFNWLHILLHAQVFIQLQPMSFACSVECWCLGKYSLQLIASSQEGSWICFEISIVKSICTVQWPDSRCNALS